MQPGEPPPSLLTLPREIRNQIYGYLTRDLELRGIRKIGDSQVFVRLTDAPYPAVFSVCTRLYAEYQEFATRDTAAIIFNRNHGNDDAYWTKDALTVRRDSAALFHLKSVTLRYSPDRDNPHADPVDLLTALTRLAPHLTTLRIAECLVLNLYTNEPIPQPFERIVPSSNAASLSLLPAAIAELPLRQRAHCRRITTRRIAEPNVPICDEHVVSQCRTHLYTIHASHADRWTAYDVVYGKMPEGFVEWTERLSEESGVEVRPRREQVVGWVEEEEEEVGKLGDEFGLEMGLRDSDVIGNPGRGWERGTRIMWRVIE